MGDLFTYIFLLFMIGMTIHRFWQTLFSVAKEKGEVIRGWTFYALSIIHFMVGIIAVLEYFWVNRRLNYYITLTGLTLFIIAFWGRAWAIKTLGRYHSAHIEIREHHPLIKNGPYRYIRHPYYLAVILEVMGFPLIPNSYYSFLVALFSYIPMVFIRLFFEEKELLIKFGEQYTEYRKEVPCIIPFHKRAT
jgi:protein-S-isoprenylcysteine O-methyltransferase Ste14